MKHEAQEATWRLRAGVVAFAGTITEMAGTGAAKLAVVLPRLGRGLSFLSIGLTWLGKAAGMGGALVMAWFDAQQARSNWRKGNEGVAFLYGASAGVGVAAALAILFGWTGVGLVLVAILLSVTLLIEMLKDNKLQEWLERCVWGNGPSARYKTIEEEMAELKKAFA